MHYLRLISLVLFLSCPLYGWGMGHAPTESPQGPLIGKAAPDAVLPGSDGTSASVVDARQGKKGILVFWTTWCPHCYEELGKIKESLASARQKGIRIILVDMGESPQDVKEYLIRRQINLTCFIDEDDTLQAPYYLSGVPTLVFIDERGIVLDVTHEFPSDYENYFKK